MLADPAVGDVLDDFAEAVLRTGGDVVEVSVLVHFERTAGGCHRIRLARIEGHAHGLDWYLNSQRVERDTV